MSTNTNKSPLIERLFSVGAHFGFKKSRRHPTVVPYLFGTKEGNDIFDLEKTEALLLAATAVIRDMGANGKTVLFVGTKTEAINSVKQAAERVAMPYVVNRWIGGTLSNFSEIRKRIARLEELETGTASGELERKYTKKERMVLNHEANKLAHNFKGICSISRLPDLLVVVDPRHDQVAVKEARDMKIPVIGIMSSDSDKSKVTYPVLVNDALLGSIALVLGELTDALAAGQAAYVPKPTVTRSESRVRPSVRNAGRG